MKHLRLLLVAIVLGAAAPAPVQIPARAIDAIFADHARRDMPGYAIGIVSRGKLVFARGYTSYVGERTGVSALW